MIRWDGSDEALQLIGGSGGYAGKREAMQRDSDGALSIWVEASRTCMWLSLGDWAAIEPGGTGIYPIRAADQEAGYEPVSSAGTPEDRSEASQLVYEYDESEPGEITNGWVARAAGVLREIADPAGGQVMVSRQDLRDLLTMTGIHAPLMAKTSGVVDRLSAAAGES